MSFGPAEIITGLIPVAVIAAGLGFDIALKRHKRRVESKHRQQYLDTRINPKQR